MGEKPTNIPPFPIYFFSRVGCRPSAQQQEIGLHEILDGGKDDGRHLEFKEGRPTVAFPLLID